MAASLKVNRLKALREALGTIRDCLETLDTPRVQKPLVVQTEGSVVSQGPLNHKIEDGVVYHRRPGVRGRWTRSPFTVKDLAILGTLGTAYCSGRK